LQLNAIGVVNGYQLIRITELQGDCMGSGIDASARFNAKPGLPNTLRRA
jgi:hypothetical protein